jgi:hypothetical protein
MGLRRQADDPRDSGNRESGYPGPPVDESDETIDRWRRDQEAEWIRTQDPKNHPLNGIGWCMAHGPSCPLSYRRPV